MFSKILLVLFASSSIAYAHPANHNPRPHHNSAHIDRHSHHTNIRWEFSKGHWVRVEIKKVWIAGHHRRGHWIPGHWKKIRVVVR